MGADAFFQACEEDVIELEPLGAVQSDQSHAGLAIVLISVAHQGCGIQEIGEGFPGFHAFCHGAREFFQVFYSGDIFRGVAIL